MGELTAEKPKKTTCIGCTFRETPVLETVGKNNTSVTLDSTETPKHMCVKQYKEITDDNKPMCNELGC